MQIPRSVIVVGKRYPRILGNNVVVNGQNRLSIYPDPCDLQENKKKDWIEDKMFRIFNRVQYESITGLDVHIINPIPEITMIIEPYPNPQSDIRNAN